MARMFLIACLVFFMTSLAHAAPVYYSISGTYEWEGHDRSLSGFVQFKDEVLYYDNEPLTEDFLLAHDIGAQSFTWFIENYNFYDGITHHVGGGGYIDIFCWGHDNNELDIQNWDWAIVSGYNLYNPFFGFDWYAYDANRNQIYFSLNLPHIVRLNSYDGIDIWLERIPATVPEPGTLFLLGSGLAGLALYRRRMNKA